jgi:ABC-type branched-subunit amino acid transport system substrate-binding protein
MKTRVVDSLWARRIAGVLLATALLLALAACGGDDEEPGTGSTGSPTATTEGTAPTGTTTSATPAPGISDTEILLGGEVILSGTLGAVYATIPKASKAYFDYINDTQGGVCGRKIVYQYEDNFDDPARAVEVARKLVDQDQVFAMLGSLGDAPHPATMEYLNEKKVPDILVSAGGHRFGAEPEKYPWTVQMIPDYTIEATFYGRYISENLPGKDVAVLWENDPVGIDALEGLKQGLDSSKNEIVADEPFNNTAVSISSQIANLKGTNAEVAVAFASPGFTAQAMKNADRLGWHPQWFMGYINSDDMMFSFASPELLNGAITFQALKLAAWRDDAAVAEHYELMRKYGGPSPTNFTIYAQALAETAVEILSRSCENLTREGLMDAVHSIKDFHTDLMLDDVTVSFGEDDHTGFQSGHMLKATLDEKGQGRFEYFGPLLEFE